MRPSARNTSLLLGALTLSFGLAACSSVDDTSDDDSQSASQSETGDEGAESQLVTGEHFTVEMPGEPSQNPVSVEAEDVIITGSTFVYQGDVGSYMASGVSYEPLDDSVDWEAENVLVGTIEEIVQDADDPDSVEMDYEAKLGDLPAIQANYLVTENGQEMERWVIAATHGKELFQLGATDVDEAEFKKFADSFKLVD